jgi:hypothetical protein
MAVERISAVPDNSSRLFCAVCQSRERIEVMTAKQRDPLVACLYLECTHAWHVTFDGVVTAGSATMCDCPAMLDAARESRRVRRPAPF